MPVPFDPTKPDAWKVDAAYIDTVGKRGNYQELKNPSVINDRRQSLQTAQNYEPTGGIKLGPVNVTAGEAGRREFRASMETSKVGLPGDGAVTFSASGDKTPEVRGLRGAKDSGFKAMLGFTLKR